MMNHNVDFKILLFGMLFLMNIFLAYADDTDSEIAANDAAPKTEIHELNYILSLDTGLTMTALRNYGFGIGVNYEHKLTNFLSIKPGFGHMTCFSDVTVVTVGIQLFFNYYPLSNGLDKLYVGLGSGCDFIMYTNDIPQDKVISLTPKLGWKWKAYKFLMIEPFTGWRFFLVKTNNYKNVDRYLNEGFQWGINIKIFMPNK